jgi:uncharacterized protein (TIGR03067 family)
MRVLEGKVHWNEDDGLRRPQYVSVLWGHAMRSSLMLFLLAGLLVAASEPRQQTAKEGAKELQGSWQAVSGESVLWELKDPGFLFPLTKTKDPSPNFRWVVVGTRLTITDAKKKAHAQRTIRADATKKPKTMEVQDGGKGRTVRAIYKLEKEKLTVVIGDGKTYPKDFKSEAGRLILTFERQKAE